MDPIPALRQHVDLVVLGQQLDLHSLANLMPGLIRQRLLITAQSPFGRPHQVGNRRIALAHLLQDRFGRYPSIHHPDALGFAVLRLDLLQKPCSVVLSAVLPAMTSYARGNPSGVTTNPMTTCTQSNRLSRL